MFKLTPRLLTALTTDQPFEWKDFTACYDMSTYDDAGIKGADDHSKAHAAWRVFSAQETLTEGFIHQYRDKVSWWDICASQTLSEQFIAAHHNQLHWGNICANQTLSEAFIDQWAHKLGHHCWSAISRNQQLSAQFMDQYQAELWWNHVSAKQELSEEFILSHLDLLDLEVIGQRYPEVYQRYNLETYRALTEVN